MKANEVLTHCPIMPVVVIDDLDITVPLANALLEGGINTMEITLRTDQGLAAIERVAQEVPEMLVGAGTVLSPSDLTAAIEHGAQYIITPGITTSILKAGSKHAVPLIPGVSNASTIMHAIEMGYQNLKFFPATINGGAAALKSYAGPFPNIKFCPTGGITEANLNDFFELENVLCVGGSWMMDKNAINNRDYGKITQLTRKAIALTK